MPSAVGGISLEQVQHNLQQCLARKDAAGAQAQLQKAKLILLQQNSLVPSEGVPVGQLKTARSVLEVGALLAIRRRDPDSFVRYYSQLQPFYEFSGLQSSPSPNKSQVTGLYLLLLLSQGDYAGFHTLLESLIVSEGINGGKSVEDDIYIKYPVDLERSLMEGSYDQVWRKTSGRDVPGEEFALFSEILVHTIRSEIASCAARSYPSLSIASAKNLLFLDSEGAVSEFAQEQGWSLEEGRIHFPGLPEEKKGQEGDQKEVISHMVQYAKDLESIV
ncbi:regulatory particle non-ATPase [Lithohypha guttulata]|nr:regulatory particle non-ATPase [Lithohypha guttulata]